VNLFVVVEGVYGMDGDIAPLDRIVPVARESGAFVALDDAHGTGVVGPHGGGAAEAFGVEKDIDLIMGTFSKALAASGAFVATDRRTVDYLRFFSRSYFFSASLPPAAISIVHAGLDLLERQPERRRRLHDNVRHLVESLGAVGIGTSSQSGIVPVYVPDSIRRMGGRMRDAGIFVNAIEFPAVPKGKERFRLSVMSEHTRDDIDALVAALDHALSAEGFPRTQRTRTAKP
jgi:glycine C-acetyltransferase